MPAPETHGTNAYSVLRLIEMHREKAGVHSLRPIHKRLSAKGSLPPFEENSLAKQNTILGNSTNLKIPNRRNCSSVSYKLDFNL